jgi:hypothetical protein
VVPADNDPGTRQGSFHFTNDVLSGTDVERIVDRDTHQPGHEGTKGLAQGVAALEPQVEDPDLVFGDRCGKHLEGQRLQIPRNQRKRIRGRVNQQNSHL